MLESLLWSYRSTDPQTKCGCVLVKDNTILSTGYNGFIHGIDDTALPNLRPFKYDFLIHAERNAIFNCSRKGISIDGGTAYITSMPCNECLQSMYQAGISRIIYSNLSSPYMVTNNEFQNKHDALVLLINKDNERNLILKYIPKQDIDFSPIIDIYEKFC